MHFTGTSMHVVCHPWRPRRSIWATRGLAIKLSPYGSLVMQHLSHQSLNGHRVIESYRVIRIVTNSRLRKAATPGRNSRPLKHLETYFWRCLNCLAHSAKQFLVEQPPRTRVPTSMVNSRIGDIFLVTKATLESSFCSGCHCTQIPKAEDGIHSFWVHQNCSKRTKLCWSQSPTANYTWNHSGCRMARRSVGIDTYQLYKLFREDPFSTLVPVNAWIAQPL